MIIHQLDHCTCSYAYTRIHVYRAFILLLPTLAYANTFTFHTHVHSRARIQPTILLMQAHTHLRTRTHTPLHTVIIAYAQASRYTQSHSATCTCERECQILRHSHTCMSSATALAQAPPTGSLPLLAFPSGFSLFCLAGMSIFGEGSIFTLSGSIFPLGHELGRSARSDLVAMLWAERAEVTLGGKPKSGRLPGMVWQPQLGLLPPMASQIILTEEL